MNLYFKRFYMQPSRYIAVAIIIFSRIILSEPLKLNGVPDYITVYTKFYDFYFISFFLPMVYCIWIFASYSDISDEKIILRSRSRLMVFLRQGIYIFMDSLLFTVLLNVTAMPIAFIQCPSASSHLLYLFINFFIQILFFLFCSFLYLIFYQLLKKSYAGFIAVILYGAMDLVVGYGNYDAKDLIFGAGRLIAYSIPIAVTNLRFLAALDIVAALIAAFIISKNDFLGRSEAKE